MKKTYFKHLFLVLLAIAGILNVAAQAVMPQISDGSNTYWYYLKNHGELGGSNSRAGKVLIKNTAGYYYGAEAWNNKSTWAKFKVVAGTTAGKYDIVSEDGLFLNKGINGDITAINVFKATDNTDWTFTATSDSRGTAAIRLFNDDGTRLQLKIATAFALRSEYAPDEDNNLWNFIPVENPIQASDETNTFWYRIQNLDSDKNSIRHKAYLRVNTADSKLVHSKLQPESWKFIAAPTSGKYYIVNENGKYITRTLESSLYTTVETPDPTCEFEMYPTFGVHSDKLNFIIFNNFESGGTDLRVVHPRIYSPYNFENYTSQDQASKWMINSVIDEANNAVTAAQNRLAATKEGNDPGMFSTTTRGSLQAVIDATIAKIQANNVSFDDANTLTSALTSYNNAVVVPQLSTEGNERWYFLQGQRPANTYLTSTGAAAQVYSYAVVPNDNQLWKFVASTTGTANGFAMVNKATGTYLDANKEFNANIFTVTAEPTNNLRFIASDIYSDKTIRFWIEHATGSTPAFRLHAGNTNVLNWNGNAYDNSSWLILDYSVALKVFLQTAITDATNLLSNTIEGTDFGQYTQANRSTLQSAITTAQGVYDNSSASSTDIETATSTLNTAVNSYKATINSNPTSLLSSNTENLRWYRIKSTSSSAYATGKVISAGTRVTGNKFTFETPADPVTDAQLFRFVLTADNSKVLHIINKKDSKFMASNGAIADASTSGNDFTLTALSDGKSFNIKPTSLNAIHAQEAGSEIVNWAGLAGSSSAWVLEYVTETAAPTVTVTSANATHGSAVINGTSNVSATSADPIAVLATPSSAEYYFVNWTNADGGALVSTSNPYSYTGTANIDLVANFATNGIPVAPMASTTEHPVYYLIQSASNATHSFSSYTGDFRGNVLISPTAAGKLIHNKLSTATSADHALWQIVNLEGVQLLKNKATGLYMTGSYSVGATGEAANAFTFDFINGSTTQYKLRTANASGSYTASWKLNLCDRLNVGDQPNSLIAWYFIAPAFTGTSDFSNTTDWTNGAIPSENMAVAINSNATITADKAFNGLHIAAGKTLTVNAGKGLTVRNAITGGGTLILKSDATNGTATVTGNVTGTATVEQYLPAATERTWWYLASPVTGAAWTVFGSNQVGSYSEATRSFSQPFTAAETLEAGRGYVVKMNAAQAANVYQFANKALNNGNISVPLTRSVTGTLDNKRGFNLVGNPYPSYLNWELAYDAASNVRSTIWYRTKGASSMEFHTYNAALGVSVPTSASGYIPPMQAFWVKVDTDPTEGTVSNGTLNFTNAMRGHANSSENRLKAPAVSTLPILRLELSNGTSSDETVIALHENASDNFDRYDSEKMSSAGTTEVFTLTGTQELVINALQTSEGSKSVRLGIRPDAAGNFTLSATEVKNMDEVQVILHDHQLNTQTELQLNESYSFTSDATATNDRFSLELRAPGMTTGNENSKGKLTLTTTEGRISIDGTTEGSPISIYNALGQQLMTQTASSSYTELNHKFQPGIYIVRINNASIKVTVK